MNSFENQGAPSAAQDPKVEQSLEEMHASYAKLSQKLFELSVSVGQYGENTDTASLESPERRDFGFAEQMQDVEAEMDALHAAMKQKTKEEGKQKGVQGSLV